MIKDLNPDHYKVDGANFLEFMNDPKISGFGNWMFANGYNSGVWASSNWISVKDRLPETEDHVLCCTESKTGRQNVLVGYYMGGLWRCGMNSNVTHWMPLPEPPKEEQNAKTD